MSLLTTRRGVIGAGAGLILATGARAAPVAEKADVIVLGAGLSGLSAAMMLAEQGASVLVLEADRRPGGRVRTLDDAPLRPEAGGAEVGPLYARLRRLCEDLKLDLIGRPPGPSGAALYLDGRLMSVADWPGAPQNRLSGPLRALAPFAVEGELMKAASGIEDNEAWLTPEAARLDGSYGALLRRLGADDEALRFAAVTGQMPTLDEVSALWMLRRDFLRRQSAGQGPVEHIRGGMSRLTDAMAATLGDRVRLGVQAVGLSSGARGVTVRDRDGRTYAAGRAIVTLPLTVLGDLAFDPLPPLRRRAAWSAVPYGQATSVFLPIKAPYWEADGLPPAVWSDATLGRVMHVNGEAGGYLWVFCAGARAAAAGRADSRELAAAVTKELGEIRPSTLGRLEEGAVFSWTRHPYSKGTFASRAPGGLASIQQALTDPFGRVHFAGEHTAVLSSGLEGALESGERAAMEVLGG